MNSKRFGQSSWFMQLLVIIGLMMCLSGVAAAATLSGTVTNPTNKAGRVYVALTDSYSNKNLGVSKTIAASGGTATFTISGVPNGTYTLDAFLDVRYGGKDSGLRHANDAYVQYGTPLTVTGDQSGLNVTLAKPTAIPLTMPLGDFSGMIVQSSDGTAVLVQLPDPQTSGLLLLPIPEAVEMTCSGAGMASATARIMIDNNSQMALFHGLTPGGILRCVKLLDVYFAFKLYFQC
ncbi:MAG: hypothetical protein WCK54_00005, partial [Desulfuromonadales bacterium]